MDEFVEFPLVNPYFYGKKSRYCYLMVTPSHGEFTNDERKDINGKGFIKYDLQEQKIEKQINYGYHQTGGEVLF